MDLELRLLSGKSIETVSSIFIKPITIDQISAIGLSQYNQFINTLCVEKEQIEDILQVHDEDLCVFDYLLLNAIYNEKISSLILGALEFFVQESVFISDDGFHVGSPSSSKILNRDNYDEFKWHLKKSNCINLSNNQKPVDKKVSDYLRKIEELKGNMNIKKNRTGNIEITDIISSVCCRHPNLNFNEIMKLTMYQLIDIFKRLHKLDDYFMNLDALIHGASKDEVNLKHYSSRLD